MRPLLAFIVLVLPAGLSAQRPMEPHSPDALSAVLTFVDYDGSVPLLPHVVSTDQALGFEREKIVFQGARGDRVPSYLSVPAGDGPFPVVLLLHAGASSKETWWDENGYERGPGLTRQLLESGYAVFALDAEHHGERMSSIDFVPIQTWYFQNEWWAVFRHMVTETAADYRRALDYLATRDQLDVSRVAAVGQSMGGVTSLILAAADPRVKTVMAGSAALAPDWLYPVAPINVASGLTDSAILLIEADDDVLVEIGWTEALHASIPATPKHMVTLASGHRLPEDYIGLTVEWVREHLVR